MLAKVRASALCELRVQLGSSRIWLVLAAGIGSVLLAYWTLRLAQGPGYTLSIVARLYDVKYLALTLGHAILVAFCLGTVFLACDLKSKDNGVGIAETLDAHAVRSHELLLGRILAVFLVMVGVAVASIAMLLIVQQIAFASGAPGEAMMPAEAALFLCLDVAPSLLFWVSVVALLAANISNRAIVAVVGSALVIAHFWCSQAAPLHMSGLVSGVGTLLPELPSDLVSWTTNHTLTVLHRIGIVVVAVGLLVASLSLPKRRDEVSSTVKWSCALVLIAVGATAFAGLMHWHLETQDRLEVWAEHHANYSSVPIADLESIEGTIRVDPGVRIDMDLVYTMQFPQLGQRDNLVLSLNPAMEIETLRLEGENTEDYSFVHGLLQIPLGATLATKGTVELAIVVTGNPDKQFGYLDDELGLWNSPRAAGLPYLALGRDASVFEGSYVALMPHSSWLPMPGPNVGIGDLSMRPRDFFEVDLDITVPTGWTIGVPGRRQVSSTDTWTTFKVEPKVPVPNFAFLAAEFEVRSLQIEGLEVELLIHKEHADTLNYAASFMHRLPDMVNPVAKRAKEYDLDYPFERFSLVEIPSNLRGYSGSWPFESVLSSPSVLMFREWTLPTAKLERFFKRYAQFVLQQEDQISLTHLFYLQSYLDSDRFGGSLRNELWRNFVSFQTHPTGEGAHALEFVIRQLTHSALMGYGEIGIWYLANVFSALDVDRYKLVNRLTNRSIPLANTGMTDPMQYLATQQFQDRIAGWEAMQIPLAEIDSRTDVHFARKVLTMKGLAISSMLLDVLGEESTGRFLGALRRRCIGRSYTFEDVEAVAKELELPALEHLDSWILEGGLPGFTVEDVEVQTVSEEDGTTSFQIQVLVRNSESMAGVVSASALSVWEQGSYWMMFPMSASKATLVPPHSKAQISVPSAQEPKYVAIQPYLSYNRSKWEVVLPDPIEAASNLNASESSNESVASLAAGSVEIVVDDLDDSFSVANVKLQPAGFLLVNLLRPGVMSPPDFDQGLPRYVYLSKEPQIWSRSTLSGAHGRYRRTTAVGIGSASGGWARFETPLPTSGEWKLYYHLPLEPKQAENYETMYSTYMGEAAAKSQPWGKQGTYQLRILQGSDVQDVAFDAALGHLGWNDLGTYALGEGSTTVEVSNESDGTYVYADAVKWVPR